MMKNILLTWWLWYIGSHTAIELCNTWYNVIIIDNLSNSSLTTLDWIQKITGIYPTYYSWDIREESILEQVFSEYKIEAVIHFAAKKAVGESMEIPFEYYDNNITWTQTLLNIMNKYNIHNIIFSSTCAVYNAHNLPPYLENMATWPESVYWLTKRINEEMIEGLVLTKKISSCILRYFNPIWNHPSGHIGEKPTQIPQNIMPIIMEVIEWKREYLTVFGDMYDTRDGTCVRDYIHVMDLAQAHVKALQWLLLQQDFTYEIINLGTGTGTTVLELIQAVQNALWISLPYNIVEPRPWDLPAVYGDCNKAKKLLWRSTQRSISEGIQDMWKFRENSF